MTGDEAALLAALPAWAFAFVLVMARIGAAIALLPGLGEAEPPPMLRVGLASAVTVLLLPGIAPLIPPVPEAGMQAAFMVAAEVITGLWIGWLARLLVLALPVAGQYHRLHAGHRQRAAAGPGTGRPGDTDRAAVRASPHRSPSCRPGSMRCRWPHSPAAIS